MSAIYDAREQFGFAVGELLDGSDDGGEEEGGPGKEPEDEQEPEDRDGDLPVVVGDAAAEEARDVLVVEIEPGPAGAGWEADAGGHGDGGVAERGEDVPGERDGEEGDGCGEELQVAELRELAGEGEVEDREGGGEDEADEAFGEDAEGEDGGEAEHGEERGVGDCADPPVRLHASEQARRGPRCAYGWGIRVCGGAGVGPGINAIEGDEEEVDGEGHPEGDEDVRDEEAGVEPGADGERHGEGGVEAAAVGGVGGRDGGEEADAERVDGEEEREDAEGEWEAGGPVVDAEEVHGAGGEPVHEGRLVEEADAVDEGRDEILAEEHLAGDFDVDGVDVVEQAGGEDAAEVEDEPGKGDEREGAEAPGAGRGGGASGGR